jgi:hypothetical protein
MAAKLKDPIQRECENRIVQLACSAAGTLTAADSCEYISRNALISRHTSSRARHAIKYDICIRRWVDRF